jgi:hypothetical protein
VHWNWSSFLLLFHFLRLTNYTVRFTPSILQDFARYKYDEYQQFSPGRRFIESLALWLRQFKTGAERRIAYNFVRQRVIFISNAEMHHLIAQAFPTIIRPTLIAAAISGQGTYPPRPKAVLMSEAYRICLRRTLVLGLSDGARTDVFRRFNPSVSNEQIWHAYDISDAKAADMGRELEKDITSLLGRNPINEEAKFRTVILLDDFTASGTSYVRCDESETRWKGKIPRILKTLAGEDGLGPLVASAAVRVIVVIYVAALQAIDHISAQLQKLPFEKGAVELRVVHELDEATPLQDERDQAILSLANQDRYFDASVDDEHGAVGGTSKRLGYAACRLPVVLSHNTPNNSIFLLWGEDEHTFRGLFPRVSRHRRFG